MKCRCGNEGRYITARGEISCAICPLKDRVDSVRISDIPEVLAWLRSYLSGKPLGDHLLRSYLGKDVSKQ